MNYLHEMLEVPSLRFIEPDYASLVNNGEPGVIISEVEDILCGAKILMDEDESPQLFCVNTGDEWVATSWKYRSPSLKEIELFSKADGDLYEESLDTIDSAVRKYFAEIILEEIPPAREDLPPDRIEKVSDLLHEVWGKNISGACLDACAGSGIGSSIVRSMGAKPLAYDNDPALLSLGLSSGRLLPEETVCIDGTIASAYLPDAEYGLGIMFGQMYVYTKELWQPIVEELCGISENVLITVATYEEAEWVAEWGLEVEKELEVFENERDPIYDRWVCVG